MAAPLQAAAEAGDPTSAISLAFHVPPRRYHQVASLLAAALSAALRPGFDFGAAAAARRWEASSDVSSTSAYSDDGDAADMEDGGAVEAAAGDDCQSCSGGGGVPPPAQGAPPPAPGEWNAAAACREGRWPWLSPRASPPQSAESPAFVAHGQWQQFQQARQGGKGAAAAGAGALASAERGAAALALNAALFAELGGQAAPGTVL